MAFFVPGLVLAQASQVADPKFEAMLKELLPGDVRSASVSDAASGDAVFLDARAPGEFAVSHIAGARHVGFEDFSLDALADLDRQQEIIVYCSVGYRSALIARQLSEAGFANVRNLYGGVFEWVNEGREVVDPGGAATRQVHAFSPTWGVWLRRGEKVYD